MRSVHGSYRYGIYRVKDNRVGSGNGRGEMTTAACNATYCKKTSGEERVSRRESPQVAACFFRIPGRGNGHGWRNLMGTDVAA